jgi:hypothetical protein
MDDTHEFLAYVDDVILLKDNVDTINKKEHGNFNNFVG